MIESIITLFMILGSAFVFILAIMAVKFAIDVSTEGLGLNFESIITIILLAMFTIAAVFIGIVVLSWAFTPFTNWGVV